MRRIKIEFDCTEEERRRVKKQADKLNLTVRNYMLDSTIYKKGRSGLNTREKACMCRIRTSLNKIEDGIDVDNEIRKIIEECEELCQYSKL